MIEASTWSEFQAAGLLWWVNRGLHLFGWVIVFEQAETGEIVTVYPARTRYRGFAPGDEGEGFKKLTEHVAANRARLLDDVQT